MEVVEITVALVVPTKTVAKSVPKFVPLMINSPPTIEKTVGVTEMIEGVLVTSYVKAFDKVSEIVSDITTTETCLLLRTVVGGTVQTINEKFVTIASLHVLPSIVTTDDVEKPVPVILTLYPPPEE